MMQVSPSDLTRNALLASLSDEFLEVLSGEAEIVALKLESVLHEQDETMDRLYFPLSGVVSMLTVMSDGHAIETSLIGREGMVGFTFLGNEISPWQALVQLRGEAAMFQSGRLRGHAGGHPQLLAVITRYALAMHEVSSQAIACNRFHSVNGRLARWLLMMHDRTDGDGFEMTHEFLSLMLGLRRATVTVALGDLETAGVIRRSGRGHIAITDREGLEALTCECYRKMRARLMAASPA